MPDPNNLPSCECILSAAPSIQDLLAHIYCATLASGGASLDAGLVAFGGPGGGITGDADFSFDSVTSTLTVDKLVMDAGAAGTGIEMAIGDGAGIVLTSTGASAALGININADAGYAGSHILILENGGTVFEVAAGGFATMARLNIASPNVPATAGAAGTAGDIAWDGGFIYVCIAANTWERVAIATW